MASALPVMVTIPSIFSSAPPEQKSRGFPALLWQLAEAAEGLANPVPSCCDQKELSAKPPLEDEVKLKLALRAASKERGEDAFQRLIIGGPPLRPHPGGRAGGLVPPPTRSGTWHCAPVMCFILQQRSPPCSWSLLVVSKTLERDPGRV